MKKLSKTRVLTWILALAPLAIVAALFSRLPDMIPMHWGLRGVRYDPKANIWWLAGMSPVLAGLLLVLPKVDPRKQNYEKFRGFYDALCLCIMILMLGVLGLVLSESFNPGRLRVEFVAVALLGLLFVFLGNMMPKIKSTFFVGIRTPWTLSNNEVWNKTHRLGGFLWFFGGLLIFVLGFFLNGVALFAALSAIIAAMVLVPVVMSYVWYRKLPESQA